MTDVCRTLITHPSAWTGSALRDKVDWIDRFSVEEIDDLARALEVLKGKGLKWGAFDREDFPLTCMKARLARIHDELMDGRGFVLLRGFPVERYSLDEVKAIYWGMGLHLGRVMPQNVKGTVLEHIEDIKVANLNDPNLRGYVTAKGLDAHCDNCDIAGLLCIDRARSGGTTVVVSTAAIHNRLLTQRPDLLEALYEGYRYDLRGEGPSGSLDETSEPVPAFSYFNGRLRGWFHRRLMLGGAVKAGIELTAVQREALDFVADAAHDPELMLEHDLKPGDFQFLNNYATLHYRTPFEDGDGHKRLLLRLWVNSRERDNMDPTFEQSWIVAGYQERDWARGRPVVALGNRI